MSLSHSTAVVMRAITKGFPGVKALDNVSLTVERGEIHAICGENGAGKSTLMKILSGVYQPDEGVLEIDGVPRHFASTREAENAGVAIIHQELNLVEELTVAANIYLGRERQTALGILDDKTMVLEAKKLLELLECSVSPLVTAGSLRVGDQQLVEIAKALSLEASIVVMDEPTSALTEAESARLERTIFRLRDRGATILYISHKMDEVFRIADRITVLRDGQHIRTIMRSDTSPEEVTSWMVGREIEGHEFHHHRQRGDVLLTVNKLTLPWPEHPRGYRLKDISFNLHAGEILGVAGLMGAGRTELLETLFGAGEPTWTGQILLHGHAIRFRHPREACTAGIGMVTEDRKRLGLFPDLDVAANISLCSLPQTTQWGCVHRAKEDLLVTESVSATGVKTPSIHASITGLSGGNQQKCIIGRWLLTKPRVLLLDDPTRGIDVGAKAELYSLIDQLCREGLAVILTSSELPELLTLSDRIIVLAEGRLTAELSRSEATEQNIVEAATS